MNNLTPVTHGLISKSQKVSLHSKHNDFTFGNKIPFIDLINYVKEDICMLQSVINTPPPPLQMYICLKFHGINYQFVLLIPNKYTVQYYFHHRYTYNCLIHVYLRHVPMTHTPLTFQKP